MKESRYQFVWQFFSLILFDSVEHILTLLDLDYSFRS